MSENNNLASSSRETLSTDNHSALNGPSAVPAEHHCSTVKSQGSSEKVEVESADINENVLKNVTDPVSRDDGRNNMNQGSSCQDTTGKRLRTKGGDRRLITADELDKLEHSLLSRSLHNIFSGKSITIAAKTGGDYNTLDEIDHPERNTRLSSGSDYSEVFVKRGSSENGPCKPVRPGSGLRQSVGDTVSSAESHQPAGDKLLSASSAGHTGSSTSTPTNYSVEDLQSESVHQPSADKFTNQQDAVLTKSIYTHSNYL